MYYGEWQVLWCCFSFLTYELGNCNLVLVSFVFSVLEVSSANWFLSYVLGFQEARKLKFETWTTIVVCGKFHEFGFCVLLITEFSHWIVHQESCNSNFLFFLCFIGTLSQFFVLIIKCLETSISNFLHFLVLFLSLRSSKNNFCEFLGFIFFVAMFCWVVVWQEKDWK